MQPGGSAAVMICQPVQNSFDMARFQIWDVAGEQIDLYFLNLLFLEGGVMCAGVCLFVFPSFVSPSPHSI